jgi:hypothetical protein
MAGYDPSFEREARQSWLAEWNRVHAIRMATEPAYREQHEMLMTELDRAFPKEITCSTHSKAVSTESLPS